MRYIARISSSSFQANLRCFSIGIWELLANHHESAFIPFEFLLDIWFGRRHMTYNNVLFSSL